VKHCLDFSNVAFAMSADLGEQQRAEMIGFFERELQTDNWLRALSPWDPDAAYSVRPDHQWNGAYTAWPADAARALVLLGRGDLAAGWLDGLARSANQGPFALAHFTTDAAPDENGGRAQGTAVPDRLGLFVLGCVVGFVLESVFGLTVPLSGEPSAQPALEGIDPDASLSALVVRGRRYRVSADGIHPEE
jgi:hypothetical protein